ncbi:protein of unknown function [Kyrpidia spormannii]|uniref:Uncharacterized protein n=1 Tax=Kyrpidia spormannii TaxID=2055160 RepID=A0A6F9EIV3_9BACL|nr:protein of unknown function [Kyrpidia spormannii]
MVSPSDLWVVKPKLPALTTTVFPVELYFRDSGHMTVSATAKICPARVAKSDPRRHNRRGRG